MTSSPPRVWLAAVAPLALSLGLAGCTADPAEPPPEHGPVRPPDDGQPYMFPDKVNTGCDGPDTFLVPLSTNLADATWSTDDPEILQVYEVFAPQTYAEYGKSWAMVRTFKAGTAKVFAESGGQRVEATVTVAQYDAAAVAAGRNRYYFSDGSGGKREACATCHDKPQGADHSPLEMAWFDDAAILQSIKVGMYPDGYVLQQVDHAWDLTAEEEAGIVPFLRSLRPRGFN